MGSFDKDEALILSRLKEVREKKVVALHASHDRLQQEVVAMQAIVALLQTKDERLKDQLKTAYSLLEDEVALF